MSFNFNDTVESYKAVCRSFNGLTLKQVLELFMLEFEFNTLNKLPFSFSNFFKLRKRYKKINKLKEQNYSMPKIEGEGHQPTGFEYTNSLIDLIAYFLRNTSIPYSELLNMRLGFLYELIFSLDKYIQSDLNKAILASNFSEENKDQMPKPTKRDLTTVDGALKEQMIKYKENRDRMLMFIGGK